MIKIGMIIFIVASIACHTQILYSECIHRIAGPPICKEQAELVMNMLYGGALIFIILYLLSNGRELSKKKAARRKAE